MKTTVKVEGFGEMEAALGEFSRATAQNVLKRAGLEALQPMADVARDLAPVLAQGGGDLKESITVSDRLSGYAKRLNRRGRSDVEVYMGPGGTGGKKAPPQGSQQEFGNVNHGPQPFMRPAWDREKGATVDRIGDSLAAEIDKATERARRKALKAGR